MRYLTVILLWMMFLPCTTMALVTSTQNGLWSNPATWGGVVPDFGETVIIAHQVTMNQDVFLQDLTIQTSGILDVSGFNLSIIGQTSIQGILRDTQTDGAHSFNGNVVVSATGQFLILDNSSVFFNGNISNENIFTKSGTGAVTFAGTVTQLITPLQSITINGNTQLSNSMTILNGNDTNDLVIFSGNSFVIDAGKTLSNENTRGLEIAGDWTGQGIFINQNNALLIYKGVNIPLSAGTWDIDQANNIVQYAGNYVGNQFIRAGTYVHLQLKGQASKILTGNITIQGNLESESSWDVSNSNYSITLAGNWQNQATFTPRQGSVILNGNTNQLLQNTSAEERFYNLRIDKSSGSVTLQNAIRINGKLTLTKGIIQAQNFEVVFTESATSDIGQNTSFIAGKVRKIGNANFNFPIGKDNIFAPFGVSGLSASTELVVQYFNQSHPSANASTTGLQYVSEKEYWAITTTGTVSAQVRLYWNNGFESGIENLTDLRIGGYNGSNWQTMNGTVQSGSTTQIGSILSSNASVFQAITFASLNGNNSLGNSDIPPQSPTLTQAKAISVNEVELKWTDNSTNETTFKIQRSLLNTSDFQTIHSAGANQTSWIDNSIQPQTTYYYRVIASNNFGDSPPSVVLGVLSAVVGLPYLASDISFKIFPNPFSDVLKIISTQHTFQKVHLALWDNIGRQMEDWFFPLLDQNQLYTLDTKNLAEGNYILEIKTPSQSWFFLVLKQN